MKYYLTTPIYYVNAAPHIGHAYTTMVADTIKRFKRMQGYEAVLTTGSDEHGVNVERSAERAGKSPKEFCDVISAEFARQWKMLGLQIDHFQRTTNPQHARVVQDVYEVGDEYAVLARLDAHGELVSEVARRCVAHAWDAQVLAEGGARLDVEVVERDDAVDLARAREEADAAHEVFELVVGGQVEELVHVLAWPVGVAQLLHRDGQHAAAEPLALAQELLPLLEGDDAEDCERAFV